MKTFLIALLSALPLFLNAQSWQWARHIGGTGMDNAVISYIDNEHNIYLYGRYAMDLGVPDFNGEDCYFDQDTLYGINSSFIAKYDDSGNLIWLHNIASSYVNNQAEANIIDMEYDSTTQSLVMAGDFVDTITLPGCGLKGDYYHSFCTFLSKIDLDGNCVWSEKLPDLYGVTSLTFDPDGNIFLAGHTYTNHAAIGSCTFDGGAFIAKLNPDGSCIWAKTKVAVGYPNNPDFGITEIKNFKGKLFAIGNIGGSGTISIDTISVSVSCQYCGGVGLLCMDNESNAIWMKVDGLPHSGTGSKCMGITDSGNILYLAGTADSCVFEKDTVISLGSNWIVVKHDENGNMIGYNHLKYETGYEGATLYSSIFVNLDGSYYLNSGFSGNAYIGNDTLTSLGWFDLLVVRFNASDNCMGLEDTRGGIGESLFADESGVYLTGIFSPFPSDTGTMNIGNYFFTTYGFEDIVFAKHDLMTGIEKARNAGDNNLVIYANPNKGSFRVKLPDEFLHENNLTFTVYDSRGKIIKSQNISLNQDYPRLDIFGQPPGVYFVTVSNGKKSYSGKMVVE